jgi:hypothetical protein
LYFLRAFRGFLQVTNKRNTLIYLFSFFFRLANSSGRRSPECCSTFNKWKCVDKMKYKYIYTETRE